MDLWYSNFNEEEIVGTLKKNSCEKQMKKSLELKKVLKRKGDILYGKCCKGKGYDSSF